jgi:hypothetical protein
MHLPCRLSRCSEEPDQELRLAQTRAFLGCFFASPSSNPGSDDAGSVHVVTGYPRARCGNL